MMLPQDGVSTDTPTPRNESAGLGQDVVGDDQREQHQRRRHHVGQDLARHHAQRPAPCAIDASTNSRRAAPAPRRGSAARRRGRYTTAITKIGISSELEETWIGPMSRPPTISDCGDRDREQVDRERPDQVEQPRDRAVDRTRRSSRRECEQQREQRAQQRRGDPDDQRRAPAVEQPHERSRPFASAPSRYCPRSPGPIGVPSPATTGTDGRFRRSMPIRFCACGPRCATRCAHSGARAAREQEHRQRPIARDAAAPPGSRRATAPTSATPADRLGEHRERWRRRHLARGGGRSRSQPPAVALPVASAPARAADGVQQARRRSLIRVDGSCVTPHFVSHIEGNSS